VSAADREKRTPLHWAAGKNAVPSVQLLVDAGADVNARDWGEYTPMHWACPMDAVESARVLVQAGARVDVADRDKRTLLHWAAEKGAERCLRFLLEEANVVDVDAVDWGGFSALHSASRRGAVACVRLLLEHGANRTLAALSGEKPIDVAADDETAQALTPLETSATLKRKRSQGSAGSMAMEGQLPALTETFYAAVAAGNLTAVREMCTEASEARVAGQAAGVLKSATVGVVHTSVRTASVHVDLTLGARGGPQAGVHRLTFDEDGLITTSSVFATM